MKSRKLTVADNLSHPPLPPGVKRGVEPPSLPQKRSHRKGISLYEGDTEVPHISLYEAISAYRLTKHEVAQITHIADSFGAREARAMGNRNTVLDAIHAVLRKRCSTQSTTTGTLFPTLLAVTAADKHGYPVSGVPVTFTVDLENENRGSFPNDSQTAVTKTDTNGVAIAPTLKAGPLIGIFTVTATALGGSTATVFTLMTNSLEERLLVERNYTRTSLAGKLEWPIFMQEILTRSIAKHELTDSEVERVISLANGWAAQKSAVMKEGWIANAIGTVLRER